MQTEEFLTRHLKERDSIAHRAWEYLLMDHASGQSIIWAVSDYQIHGPHFYAADPILPDALFGNGGSVIVPRILKHTSLKNNRTRQKAEVFTPSWVCNRQNNLIDAAWFGRPDVFNQETPNGWNSISHRIFFPKDNNKTWQAYVDARRMEIACGEAPYLTSRYDTTSGQQINLSERIGMLDRKLRIVDENTTQEEDWFTWALRAVEACYGYEWQGDSLFLARENLLLTVMDYYRARFDKPLSISRQRQIAYRLSWNLWQMDALKGVIPGSCQDILSQEITLMGNVKKRQKCPGCEKPSKPHNGTYCLIRNWRSKITLRYVDLLSRNRQTAAIGGTSP